MGWFRRSDEDREQAAEHYAVMDNMEAAWDIGTDAAWSQFARGRDEMAEHWSTQGWDVPTAWGYGEQDR